MPARPAAFKFGSFVVRVSECFAFLTEEPCIPPSCTNHSICLPPGRTLARVKYDPRKDDPAELKRLITEVQRLRLEVEVVVGVEGLKPGDAVDHVGRALS